MVPRIGQGGRSFKGAALYYLHDKKADTSDRVAFVETVNLPTNDPQRAVAHMIDTAAHADELKRAAGLKAGRKLEKPVYTYSLAWHPDQAPTMAEQVAAARETLDALGLSDRQAMIVAHNDTKHPHVHVIVNRVCPETGRAALTSNDQLILSRWAEAYERKHGRVYCEARVAANETRANGRWKKDDSPTRAQWQQWKKETTAKIWDEYRAERDGAKASRRGQYDALWQQRETRFGVRRLEIKQLYKPQWRDLFKRQRIDLRQFDRKLSPRLKFALTNYEKGKAMAVLRAFTADQVMRNDYIKAQERDRLELAKKQKQAVADAAREVTKAWQHDRDELRTMHAAEDQHRLHHYKGMADAVWKHKLPADEPSIRRGFEAANDSTPDRDPPEPPTKTREMVKDRLRKSRGRSKGRTRHRPR